MKFGWLVVWREAGWSHVEVSGNILVSQIKGKELIRDQFLFPGLLHPVDCSGRAESE